MPQVFEAVLDEKGNPITGFKRDVATGIIYKMQMMHGEYFRFSTEETEFTKAQKVANAKIADFFRRGTRRLATLLIDEMELLEQNYLTRVESKEISPGTYRIIKNELTKLKPFWGNLYPGDITKEKWSEGQDWFNVTYKGQGQFNATKTMKVLVSHLLEKGLLLREPTITDKFAKVKRMQRKKRKARVYTDAEILALDEACETDLERLAMRLMYQMGFRISDVVSLHWDRINLKASVPVVNFTEGDDKADFEGKCPISDDVCAMLVLAPTTGWLFPQMRDPSKPVKTQIIDRMFRAIRERAKVTHGSPHSLRHYRLTKDFKDPRLTTAQVCVTRRVSLKTAFEHYVHTEEKDLQLVRNTGSLKTIRKNVGGRK